VAVSCAVLSSASSSLGIARDIEPERISGHFSAGRNVNLPFD
jgi:hypothetical protein